MSDLASWPLEPAPHAALRDLTRVARPVRLLPAPAPEIDAELVGLVHDEAPLRREIGLIADRFLAIRGYEWLGFVRVGDYAVERLGISGRELRSLAFVASRLEERTLVRRAFLRGGISWSQARLLASVTEPETEERWLARAEELTVEELARVTKLARSADGSAAAELEGATEEVLGATGGEETARFALRCPARVLSLWRRALELARRMIGAEVPDWQAAEAIAAESCSATPPSRARRRRRRTSPRRRAIVASLKPTSSTADARPLRRPGCRPRPQLLASRRRTMSGAGRSTSSIATSSIRSRSTASFAPRSRVSGGSTRGSAARSLARPGSGFTGRSASAPSTSMSASASASLRRRHTR